MTGTGLPASARCVVIGTGAVGSAAAYRLGRRIGDEVLVLEQFIPGHTRGASEDHSRIIRHSYGSTVYTRLTRAMFQAWREVEAESGIPLVTVTGGLDLGDPRVPGSVEVVRETATALSAEGIGFELLDAREIRQRWPQWRLPDDVIGLYQPDGGNLDIGRACSSHLALAAGHGARLCPSTRVLRIELSRDDSGVRIETDRGPVDAETVVVCAGKWTNGVLGSLRRLPLVYTREQVTYFAPRRPADYSAARFPVWIRHGDPCFYGLGVHGIPAIKIGEDLGGPQVQVDDLESPVDPEREEKTRRFLLEHLPDASGPIVQSRACLYELPPDRHFFLGAIPESRRVLVAIGAGHGAKFAALFGTVLSEIALDGETAHPIEPFAVDRPLEGWKGVAHAAAGAPPD